MLGFLKKNDGYVVILGLLMMPVLLGFSLFAMDMSRATNAHSDAQATADALALAGARELDGSPDSIDRAKAAMAQITNSVSFLSTSDTSDAQLTYAVDDTTFNVIFLTTIPPDDDTPIDQAWVDDNATNSGFDAAYIYVSVRTDDLNTFFPRPGFLTSASVPIQTSAVATYRSAACDVTPLFICNPFEGEFTDLQEAFAEGHMHGRLVKLHPTKGSNTAGPGNFGFLQVTNDSGNLSASAAAIRAMFAGGQNPSCYDSRRVVTKPGAANGIRHGINTRFDMYEGPYSGKVKDYPPAVNVRKGYVPKSKGGGNECNVEPSTDLTKATGFPPNATMSDPNPSNPGAYIGSGDWDVNTYWNVNHPGRSLPADLDSINSMPNATSPGTTKPSRYDIYRYEISQGWVSDVSAGGETGAPACYNSKTNNNDPAPSDDPDRRVIFAAIINCNENPLQGSSSVPVAAFASAFMVSPMENVPGNDPDVPDKTIDLEVIDITGSGGNGTLDEFVRQESLLVR